MTRSDSSGALAVALLLLALAAWAVGLIRGDQDDGLDADDLRTEAHETTQRAIELAGEDDATRHILRGRADALRDVADRLDDDRAVEIEIEGTA